jgi:hypothetical protein
MLRWSAMNSKTFGEFMRKRHTCAPKADRIARACSLQRPGSSRLVIIATLGHCDTFSHAVFSLGHCDSVLSSLIARAMFAASFGQCDPYRHCDTLVMRFLGHRDACVPLQSGSFHVGDLCGHLSRTPTTSRAVASVPAMCLTPLLAAHANTDLRCLVSSASVRVSVWDHHVKLPPPPS